MTNHSEEFFSNTKLVIKVTPRAKKNEITGFLDDGTIKVRLNAPPVDGKANKELIRFLAELLRVRKSSIQIVSGKTSRKKIVHIEGCDPRSVQAILNPQ
jgi:uncharacterized protein (TIGR00251 family)